MGKNVGWEKIERDLLDSVLWTSMEPFNDRSAYIDLRLRVNFVDAEFNPIGREVITVHAGEIFTSITKLAERWHWSQNRVRRYLKFLEDIHFARVKTYTYGVLITLMNTDKSGNDRRADGRGDEVSNESTDEVASESTSIANYGSRYDRTSESSNGRTNGTQYKNVKNDRKEQKEKDISRTTDSASRRGIALGGIWGGDPE